MSICIEQDCNRQMRNKKSMRCHTHNIYLLRQGYGLCRIENCEKQVVVRKAGLCSNHYQATEEGRNRALKQKYGITLEQYEAMVARQHNLCAICGKPQSIGKGGKPSTLCVDHDHKTGEVRGLLCYQFNAGLGHFKDSIQLMANAIRYLKKN